MRRKFRKKCLESYRVVADELTMPPLSRYIPIDKARREKVYKEFASQFGIPLPRYEGIVRERMAPEDLRVLWDEWSKVFEYRGGIFRQSIHPGFIWDGASIPTILVMGSLTKNGQHIEEAALGHDENFANHEFPLDDCNIIFKGDILHQAKLGNKRAKRIDQRAFLGVQSPIGKRLYRNANVGATWQEGFYHYEELQSMQW